MMYPGFYTLSAIDSVGKNPPSLAYNCFSILQACCSYMDCWIHSQTSKYVLTCLASTVKDMFVPVQAWQLINSTQGDIHYHRFGSQSCAS